MFMHLLTAPARRVLAYFGGRHTDEQSPLGQRLFFKYEPETDLLFARFGEPTDADTVVVEPGVSVRISRTTGEAVAIEVLECAVRFSKPERAINAAFARQLLAEYGLAAIAHLLERRARRDAILETVLHTR
jgi:hypothetical protein